LESEAARRAADAVCHLVDGYLCFYLTILKVMSEHPDKAEILKSGKNVWDIRQKPLLCAQDVLELKKLVGFARRDRRPVTVRSLFNCFRYLEPQEKLKFLAGLATFEQRARTGESSA